MGHSHHHHHHHAQLTGRKLGIAFFLSFIVLAVLFVGGWLSGSLALMADAGHVVTDIAALGLSWYATRQALKPADPMRTFGYHRTGILAALANAVSLILIAIYIAYEAYHRFLDPHEVHSGIMIVAAAIGMVINLGIGFGLQGESEHNLNVRSAFLHVMGDAAASAGVIVGAIAIFLTGWHWIDPFLSVAIAVFIAYGAWQVVDESLHILMEGTPRGLDVDELVSRLKAIDGVRDVHDLHVWSIASGVTSMSCHLVIEDQHVSQSMRLIAACNELLEHDFHITHTTIQPEAEHCSPDSPECNLGMVVPHDHGHDHSH